MPHGHWIYTLPLRLRSLFRRQRVDQELDVELRYHIERKTEENAAKGMTPEDARRAALLEMRGIERAKEECRDTRRINWMQDLLQDLRYGLRVLRKSPGFTTVAVLTLALGIGANTAIFSVLNSVLLRDLPVKEPQQLVFLTHPNEQGMEQGFGDGDRDFLTYPEFQQLEANNSVFSGLLAASSSVQPVPIEIEGAGGNGEPVFGQASLVSGSYSSVLGVAPILGRTFTTEVDKPRDANPVAVISYGFWQERFAGSPAVLGRIVRIHDTSFDIVGVMPPQFRGETVGASPEIWVPLSMQSEIDPGRDYLSLEPNPFHKTEWLQAIGRLKPGVSVTQANASINVEFQQLMESQTAEMSADKKKQFLNQHLAVVEGSHGASTLRDDFGKPLKVLMAIAGLILLIACTNIANILLARSAARQKEISVRVAMGAGAQRLFRQVFTESILLGLIGGAVGLVFSHWADVALLQMVSRSTTVTPLDVDPDARILAFTFAVAVLTGVLFGLAPALRAAHVDISSVLKGASRSVAGTGSHPGRVPIGKTLVVAQVTLSLLLLVVAGLFLRSFQRLAEVKLGYDRDHLLTFTITPLSYGYKGPEIAQLYTNVLARLDAVPGVRGASLIDNGLFSGFDSNSPVRVDGEKPKTGDDAECRWDLVGPNFFSTSGIAILYGREIEPQDSGNGQRVGVVNEEFVRYYLTRGSNPIGKRVHVMTSLGDADFMIVGVAANAKQHSVREKPWRRFYAPFFNPIGEASDARILVRTVGDPATVQSAIRLAAGQTATNLPPIQIWTLKTIVSDTLTNERMITQLSTVFGVLAVVLACIGLYGVMSYIVSGRINEIGLRMTLGAQRADVLWLILRESLLLILIGVVIGLPAVFGAGKWIASLLYGVAPADPAAIMVGAVLMFAVGTMACYIPARRAMKVDPMVALRYE